MSAPLSDLLKKGNKFAWTEGASDAFEKIKTALVSKPVLTSPNYDEPFIIQTDVSDAMIGGVLV